jgi:hypothetical protein
LRRRTGRSKPRSRRRSKGFGHSSEAQEDIQRARQIRYYRECAIPAFPGDPKNAPPSYRYFVDMVERLKNVKPEDLTENSVLLGSSARIVEILKKVDAAGFDEVILYVNVGLKPHQQVKDEMARFMAEVAPAFASARKEAAARVRRPRGRLGRSALCVSKTSSVLIA